MSDYGSVAEKARRAFASLARVEAAARLEPDSAALQIKLAGRRRFAEELKARLYRISEVEQVEVCDYRLVPQYTDRFALGHVTKSLLDYQNVFSQVYDALKNGPKKRALIGKEAEAESSLEFAYSYSGSLGVVLLAPSQRDFFSGQLDTSIDALFQVIEITNTFEVRDLAKSLGEAVVKRIHDWSEVNVKAGFAIDLQWSRSDGRKLGSFVNVEQLERIASVISSTSDVQISEIDVVGTLVGVGYQTSFFHFVVTNGEDYRGGLADDYDRLEVSVPGNYRALISQHVITHYATGREERHFKLKALMPLSP